MDSVLVDTDVVSHLWRKDDRAENFLPFLKGRLLTIAFTSVAELHFGAYKSGWGERRRAKLEQHIKKFVLLPFDDDLARLWGRLRAEACRNGGALGQPAQANDLWIAACSIYYQAPLLTDNKRHMVGIDGLVLADQEQTGT